MKAISNGQPAVSKNVFCLALVTLLLAFCFSAKAQESQKMPRVGFLLAPSPAAVAEPLDAFRQGMRELGYVEGKNIIIEYRSAEGKRDRLPGLATELVRLKVDVIVATGGPQTVQTAKNVTSTIPIVMTGMGDPIMTGLIVSYARPGGNITGITLGGLDLYGKRLEVLKEAVPRVAHVAFFVDPKSPGADLWLKAMEPSAQVLGLQVRSFAVRSAQDFESAFQTAIKCNAHGFIVAGDPQFTANRKIILNYAAKNRLPGIYPFREYVEEGGLMSYASKLSDLYRRAATYVDKILKGARPADLPVEQPTKFELVINLKTAKQIGLIISPNVLARADRVIK